MSAAQLCSIAHCDRPAGGRSMVLVLPGVVARRLPLCDRCFDEAGGDLARLVVSWAEPEVLAAAPAPPQVVASPPVAPRSDLETVRRLTSRLLRGPR